MAYIVSFGTISTLDRSPAHEKPGSDFRAKLARYGIKQDCASDVAWNFEKFLISRKGKVVGRFLPDTSPEDPSLTEAVERELLGW